MSRIKRFICLAIPFFWYLEAEWDWSNEMDGLRSPRRFYRNKFFKDSYIITEVFNDKKLCKSKFVLVAGFVKSYLQNTLLGDNCHLVYSLTK